MKNFNQTFHSRIICYTLTFFIAISPLFYFTGCNAKQEENKAISDSNLTKTESNIVSESNSSKEINVPVPESYMITSKNYFDYQSGFECSAFSSAYILRHYGEEANGVELFKTFPGKVSDGGVAPFGIVSFFQNREYEAEYKCDGTTDDLKRQISKGIPVIVFIRVSEQEVYTHYVPLVGYDKDYFYFAESLPNLANCKDEKDLSYNRKTEISTFKCLWDNIDGMWNYPYFVVSKKTST